MAPTHGRVIVPIYITSGGVLEEPDLFECHSASEVVLLLINTEPTGSPDRWVGFDTTVTIYLRDYDPANPGAGPFHDPFEVKGPTKRKVRPGEIDMIRVKINRLGAIGPGTSLDFTAYKYTLVSADDNGLTTNRNVLDPGFVISRP